MCHRAYGDIGSKDDSGIMALGTEAREGCRMPQHGGFGLVVAKTIAAGCREGFSGTKVLPSGLMKDRYGVA